MNEIQGTVLQIEKALINDCLLVPENLAFQLFITLQ